MADQHDKAEAAADKAEAKVAARTRAAQQQGGQDQEAADARRAAGQDQDPGVTDQGDVVVGADASLSAPAPVVADVRGGAAFAEKVTDAPVDSRTGREYQPDLGGDRFKGRHGEEILAETGPVVAGVDPDRIPAEAIPGYAPDAQGDKLLAAAQAKAPSLTREFVDQMEIDEQMLAQIARGEIPPPPTPGPLRTNDLYLTPGGYQVTPPGVPPEDVGKNAISR